MVVVREIEVEGVLIWDERPDTRGHGEVLVSGGKELEGVLIWPIPPLNHLPRQFRFHFGRGGSGGDGYSPTSRTA